MTRGYDVHKSDQWMTNIKTHISCKQIGLARLGKEKSWNPIRQVKWTWEREKTHSSFITKTHVSFHIQNLHNAPPCNAAHMCIFGPEPLLNLNYQSHSISAYSSLKGVIDPQSISKYLFRSISKFDKDTRIMSGLLRQLPPPQLPLSGTGGSSSQRMLQEPIDVRPGRRRGASSWHGLTLETYGEGKWMGNPIEMEGFQSPLVRTIFCKFCIAVCHWTWP